LEHKGGAKRIKRTQRTGPNYTAAPADVRGPGKTGKLGENPWNIINKLK